MAHVAIVEVAFAIVGHVHHLLAHALAAAKTIHRRHKRGVEALLQQEVEARAEVQALP